MEGAEGGREEEGEGSLLDPRIMDNFHGFSTSMRIDWVVGKAGDGWKGKERRCSRSFPRL